MLKRKDLFIGVLALALVAGAAYVLLAPGQGERAPDVTYTMLDGRQVSQSELTGKPTLVTFWATTCVSCVQEIPHLIELYDELNPRGFEIVAIAMEYDPPNQVEALVESRELNYPIALDQDGSAARAFGDVRLTPTTFLINPQGHIVQRKIGLLDMDRLRSRILDMLPPEQQASLPPVSQG